MTELTAPQIFCRKLLQLLAQGQISRRYRDTSSDASWRLDLAEAKAWEVSNEKTINYKTAADGARVILKKYEDAEKEARKAAAIAKEGKERATAVVGLLERHSELVTEQIKKNEAKAAAIAAEEAKLIDYEEDTSSEEDSDRDTARASREDEGSGDQGTTQAA